MDIFSGEQKKNASVLSFVKQFLNIPQSLTRQLWRHSDWKSQRREETEIWLQLPWNKALAWLKKLFLTKEHVRNKGSSKNPQKTQLEVDKRQFPL